MTPPLLRDVVPELEAELRTLLIESGELAFADQVRNLAIFDRCRCGDSFCSSFYTVPERCRPFPGVARTLVLRAGQLNLDVLRPIARSFEVRFRRIAEPTASCPAGADAPRRGRLEVAVPRATILFVELLFHDEFRDRIHAAVPEGRPSIFDGWRQQASPRAPE
jgi:hypothetical protein